MPAAGPQPDAGTAINRFITLEGGEGGGKSTQIRHLAAALQAGRQVVRLTREPGGAPGAEDIRRLLVEGEPGRWTAESEALLHFAARADHLAHVIRPALAAGEWVLCDRFADSSIAYQGYGHGLDLGWLKALRHRVVGPTEPGLTIILDLPVEVGLARAAQRSQPPGPQPPPGQGSRPAAEDRYERMDRGFHQRLRDGFLAIAAAEPARCKIVDANRPLDEIARDLRSLVTRHFAIELG
jgi:dTMP kinase